MKESKYGKKIVISEEEAKKSLKKQKFYETETGIAEKKSY